jgi:Na+-translocating ferredoxin:NAD+ oxidoreductase subunit G
MKSMVRFGSILGLICLLATALLAVMNAVTAGRINAQAKAELQASLSEVMPGGAKFEPVNTGNETLYFKVISIDGQTLGAAFKASAKGYSSFIETIVGMKPDGTITAIKIISQQETPGLGSKITETTGTVSILDYIKGKRQQQNLRPWFQEQFDRKKITNLDQVEAITGATISSRSVIESIKQKAQQIQAALNNEQPT